MKTIKKVAKPFVILNSEDEPINLSEIQFIEHIIEHNEIPETVETDHDVVKGLIGLAKGGNELVDDIEETMPGVTALYDFIIDAINTSKELVEAAKASKAKAKEEKAAEKEAKAKEKAEAAKAAEKAEAELAKKQIKFGEMIKKADKRDDLIVKEIKALQTSLPKELTLTKNAAGNGFALEVADGAELTDAALAKSIGAIASQQGASDFMTQSRGFLLGGLANEVKRKGLYKSLIQASQAISNGLPEAISINGKAIESYARMDSRIPLEHRNSTVKDAAYLKLSNSKLPKKAQDETDEQFEARTDAYISDRNEIAEGLGNGQIENAKEVAAKVIEMEVKHGIREAKDPNAKTAGDYFKQFFFATFYKDKLAGVHDEGAVIVSSKDGEELTYSVEELDALITESTANLSNTILAKVAGQKCGMKEFIAGEVVVQTTVLTTDEETGKEVPKRDDKDEVVYEDKAHKAYPPNPFKS